MRKKSLLISIISLLSLLPNLVYANTIINTHKTSEYSKEEVIAKYKESKVTFDYNNDNIYSSIPNFDSPTFEGVIKEAVRNDVLKSINYFRFLAGVNPLTLNTEKMSRSQKGAYILSYNNTLTHYPTKPEGMNQDFYQEAYDGTNAKCNVNECYSGNVSYGSEVKDIVKDYVDDSNNVQPNVGHRSSMLEPRGTKFSFGYISSRENRASYSAISVYYDPYYVSQVDEPFYAWPPAGYIPAESFPANSNTMWSIWIDNDIAKTENTIVEIAFNNKTYTVSNSDIFNSGIRNNVLYYYVPTELNNIIRRSNNQYVVDKPIGFKVKNLNRNNELIDIEYTTTFIQAEIVDLEEIEFWFDPELRSDGYTYYKVIRDPVKSVSWKVGDKHEYNVVYNPRNATVSNYKIEEISNNKLLTIDDSNHIIEVKKGGTTKIKITEEYTGKTKEFEATIPVTKIMGDVTKDGSVDLVDVMYALRISLNLMGNISDEVTEIGDINGTGSIDLADVMYILRIALNLA